jgi:hypothetical protein
VAANLPLLERDPRVTLERVMDLREYYEPFRERGYGAKTWIWRIDQKSF